MSKYTDHIESVLHKSPFTIKRELQFPDLKWKLPLRFDYGIYKDGKLIALLEVDGEQHFAPIAAWGGRKSFLKIQELDRKKNRYSLVKNIQLYRVPFFEVYNIKSYSDIFTTKFLVTTQWHNDNVRKILEKFP